MNLFAKQRRGDGARMGGGTGTITGFQVLMSSGNVAGGTIKPSGRL
jgi:hypothetical protein